jgi:hypothetical protein
MAMLTTQEILKRTGLKTRHTLTTWHKAGLITPPKIMKHPSGKGVHAVWPDEVLEQCMKLATLRKPGRPTSDAKRVIETIRVFQTEGRRKYFALGKKSHQDKDSKVVTFKKDPIVVTYGIDLPRIFVAMLMPSLCTHITKAKDQESAALEIKRQNVFDSALSLLKAGYSPTLIIEKKNFHVWPDFMISHHLSQQASSDNSFVLIPLLAPLKKAFQAARLSFPETQLATPAPRIRVPSGSESTEKDIAISADGSFKVVGSLGPDQAPSVVTEDK